MCLSIRKGERLLGKGHTLTIDAIYDILRVEKIRVFRNPSDKGKPFERVGHKALEPTSPSGLTVVSCQKGRRF